jgi:hypothetical protein
MIIAATCKAVAIDGITHLTLIQLPWRERKEMRESSLAIKLNYPSRVLHALRAREADDAQ